MNSNDWKSVVATIAPMAATLIGGPLAGGFIATLSQTFLGHPNGTEAEVAPLIAAATPDVFAKIREAEQTYKTALLNAGVKLEDIAANDRNSARQREMSVKDMVPRNLAYFLIGSTVAIIVGTLLGYTKVDSGLAGTLIGYLISETKSAVQYYFGSTSGSSSKNEILDKAINS